MKLDLKEWIAKVTGQTEFKTLLWTNTSPTTGFGAQTVQLDLSGYDDVEVEWIHNTNEQNKVLYNRCKVGKSSFLFVTRVDIFLTQMRQLDANSNGIYFGDCQLGSNATIYNNHCIPYHIYGIRYVGG